MTREGERRAAVLGGTLAVALGCNEQPPGSSTGAAGSGGPPATNGTAAVDDTGPGVMGSTTSSGAADETSGSSEDDGPPIVLDVGPKDLGNGGDPCGYSKTILPVTIRDFLSTHSDFESYWGELASSGLVMSTLGADGKPVFNPTPPTPPRTSTPTQITSPESFAQWYHDTPGINVHVNYGLLLEEVAPGDGVFAFERLRFFPIDDEGWNVPGGAHVEMFPDDLGAPRNFHFTTEIHAEFIYEPGQNFRFRGDDDLWVFIDGELAIDLGGLHGALDGEVELDTLGLVAGETYDIDIFHAERRHIGSQFTIETSISCFLPPAG
ncbi:MAG: fibro-slime domain-containing protein [Myxococcota bacterium]